MTYKNLQNSNKLLIVIGTWSLLLLFGGCDVSGIMLCLKHKLKILIVRLSDKNTSFRLYFICTTCQEFLIV